MEQFTEEQRAAHQAIAEIVADLGASFTLQAVADAFAHATRSETGTRGDNLGHATDILRQLSSVLAE